MSSSRTSRNDSECSAAELAGKMADLSVDDSCHGNTSLPADSSLVDENAVDEICTDERDKTSDTEAAVEEHESCTIEIQQRTDEPSDTEAAVEEHCREGV